jgi:osmotically inducible lipoprotein OsmB
MLIAAGFLLTACGASMSDRALSGGAIGAGAGALGGALIGIPAAGAAIGAAAGVGVGVATTPRETTAQASPPPRPVNADHVVTTYLTSGRAVDQARAENIRFARRFCGGGAVLVDEQQGSDATGSWLRLVYACLAADSLGASPLPANAAR